MSGFPDAMCPVSDLCATGLSERIGTDHGAREKSYDYGSWKSGWRGSSFRRAQRGWLELGVGGKVSLSAAFFYLTRNEPATLVPWSPAAIE
jgi:hypothetical protein